MNIVKQQSHFFNNKVSDVESPTAVLKEIDLVEYEIDYTWQEFEYHTLAAEHYLQLHDAATIARRQLARLVSLALAETKAVPA
jgi:hypothetical protein